MGEDAKDKSGRVARWRASRRTKREQRGPSADALQEQRNSDKVVDPTAVARNADKMFGPWGPT